MLRTKVVHNAAVRTVLSWLLGLLVPKDPKLYLFGGRQYGGNTAPVFERAADFGLEAWWLTKRPEILAMGHPRILDTRSLKALWLAARARGVVLTHSLGDFGPLKFPSRRTRVLNLWHGMPIKRISRMDPRFHTRSYAKGNLREMKRFELMFATSPAMAELFAQTFMLPMHRVLVTGQPRTDALFDEVDLGFLERFSPALPAHSRRVLYCPTWREGTPVRLFPFEDRDLRAIDAALETLDAVMMVRTHPNDPGRLTERHGRIVPMQGDVAPEVTDVLPAFDALITDYSSVWYDFLLLDRPTIFLPYDLAAYSEAPGFYLPFEETIGGPCPATQADFVVALEAALLRPGTDAAERARVSALVYSHTDAGSTARVLEAITQAARPGG